MGVAFARRLENPLDGLEFASMRLGQQIEIVEGESLGARVVHAADEESLRRNRQPTLCQPLPDSRVVEHLGQCPRIGTTPRPAQAPQSWADS